MLAAVHSRGQETYSKPPPPPPPHPTPDRGMGGGGGNFSCDYRRNVFALLYICGWADFVDLT